LDIIKKAESVRTKLKNQNDFSVNQIDMSLPIIPPFIGTDEIRLIIIGQDPTIRNSATRKKITCTLNLDKKNVLKVYIDEICKEFDISIENVYATNLFKYFYTIPPADTTEVLQNHLTLNLNVLKQELAAYKNTPVIVLGETILQLLTTNKTMIRTFWDYNKKTRASSGNFSISTATDNKLNRDFYPFPHQPSLRKEFYKNTLKDYIKFMRK
jgi:uracil-DNA glycosylase